jgi:serine/threonine-protein kinase
MLDMAFDKLRRVPVDDEMKDILYNLALDYERKRQYNKAASVYEYIEEHDATFKDVGERKKKLIQASETMMFGDGFLGGGPSDDGLTATGTDTRPTLGRYEVIKQLGKGAMGIVYLGQDPRINRTTAIKTFRFSDDIAPEDMDKMRETFLQYRTSSPKPPHEGRD